MCTGVRFSDDAGNMYFGRNLDWSVGYGQKIIITPRGYKYKSAFLGEMGGTALIGMGIVAVIHRCISIVQMSMGLRWRG